MKFARWVFGFAGVYGFLLVTPLYWMEGRVGHDYPPAIAHPEYFYGFIGVTLAWQLAFLLIARAPSRHRPLMLASIAEKAVYGGSTIALFASHRLNTTAFGFGLFDVFLGVLFVIAYRLTPDWLQPGVG